MIDNFLNKPCQTFVVRVSIVLLLQILTSVMKELTVVIMMLTVPIIWARMGVGAEVVRSLRYT